MAVVLAALVSSTGRSLLLSAAYRAKAGQYQIELMGITPILMGPKGSHSATTHRSAHVLWAERMAEKYLRASRFPWLALEPDPPPP